MVQKLKIKGIEWCDAVNIEEVELQHIIQKYHFHELDVEACLEENQRPRIDTYDDYIFMVLHFPKYNTEKHIYELNEFNIFLGKNFLITLRKFNGTKTSDIFNKYKNVKIELKMEKNNAFKISSGFILYEIIQAMLEKVFKMHDNITSDLKILEKHVFDNSSSSLVQELMIKKRNIIVLKHMITPQVGVLKSLEYHMNSLFSDKIEAYFEDLEDKIGKVVNDIKVLEEYINSIEGSFKLIVDIKTNNVMRMLTVFSAFLLPLTLITSFYGMNISLPYSENMYFVFLLLCITSFIMVGMYYYLRKRGTV